MEYSDAVNVLREIPLFAELDPSKLKLVAFTSVCFTFEDGEALFKVGDTADCVYLIEDGEVGLFADREGRESCLAVLGRHALFGEMAILRNSPRIATMRARGQLRVLRIDAGMFLDLITEDRAVALGVMRELSEKIARAMERFGDLGETVRRLQSVADLSPPSDL